MRKSLFTAAALAPFILLAAQSGARADTTISNTVTTPVTTSTGGNVTITSGGAVKPTGGVAVTIDSSNTVTNQGTISIDNVDHTTGVLIQGGNTGALTNTGTISMPDDLVPKDTDSDGVVDGPFAQGTDRYGVHLTGGTFTGNITSDVGSSITVHGNNSYGVALEGLLQGNLSLSGATTVVGDNTFGVRETGGVNGAVKIAGGVSATGANAVGLDIGGDVSGSLTIYSGISATGYRITSRQADPAVNDKITANASEVQQSGSAVQIRASVAGGVFLAQPPTGTTSATTTDGDGDGVADGVEGTGSIAVYGSAPALKVGNGSTDVHIGAFGTGDNAYGIILRGGVSASGVFDGTDANPRPATAIQLGDAAGGTVHIDGGLRMTGSMTSLAYADSATGIHVLSGTTAPEIRNEGTFTTAAASAVATPKFATGLLIEAGANVTAFTNSGTFTAGMASDNGSSYAVRDLSGTLSTVTNTNLIRAQLNPTAVGDAMTGTATALDLRLNTTGVTLTQNANPLSTTESPITPKIIGDIFLGAGNDVVAFNTGSVTGGLSFSTGTDSLLINGGAVYSGAMTSGGILNVNVLNGTLNDTSPTTINANSLNVGATGILVVAADPTAGHATQFNVSGAANIASGGRIGLNLQSLPNGTATFTIVQAGSLTVGDADSALLTDTPYLFVTGLHTDTTAGTIDLTIRRRTAVELNLNAAETSAYNAIYNNLPVDSGIEQSILAQKTQAGFLGLYDQLLPDYAGGVMRALSWATEATGKAAADWPAADSSPGPTRGWTQEIVISESKSRDDVSAYRMLGIGLVGGIESMSADGDAVGATFGFTTADISNPDTPGDDLVGVSQISAGLYWRGVYGRFHTDASVGASYIWANTRREFIYSDGLGTVVHRTNKAKWSGYDFYGRMGVAYEMTAGPIYIRPGVHVDYFHMNQGGYTETGGGNGFDLTVNSASGDLASATASVIIGATYGTGIRWRPEVEVGYRDVFAGSGGGATAAFTGGGLPFTLPSQAIRGGGAIARIGIRAFADYVDLKIDAGGEFRNGYTDLDFRFTIRIVF